MRKALGVLVMSGRWLGGVALLLLLAQAGCSDEDTNLPFTIVTTPTSPPTGPTPIFFTITEQADRNVNAQAEVTTNQGQTFQQATLASGSPSLNQLQGSPTGEAQFFFWDPQADLGAGLHRNVILRVFAQRRGAFPSDTAPLIVDLTDRLVDAPLGAPPLSEPAGAPFPDGSVYVTAGLASGGGVNSGGYRFVPSSNTIQTVPALSVGRNQVGIALLTRGQIVVAGGTAGGARDEVDVVRLDATGSVSVTPISGGLTVARSRPAVVGLSDGRAAIFGGDAGGAATDAIEVFTPTSPGAGTGTISTVLSSSLAARIGATATRLADGRVLLAGGVDGAGAVVATTGLVDSGVASVTTSAALAQGRTEHGAALLPDGRVVIVGGTTVLGDDSFALATAEIFDPATETFSQLPPMRFARRRPGVAYANGAVVVFGGAGSTDGLTQPERYDLKTGQWIDVEVASSLSRADAVAVTYGAGQVFVAGGGQLPELYVPNADLGPQIFESLEDLPLPRADHTATRLADGTVLIAGGTAGIDSAINTVELFDPVTETFSTVAAMSNARAEHAAVLTTTLGVLVVGGRDENGLVAQAEVYDPPTNRWINAGTLNVPRADAQAGLLTDGRILIVGGVDASGQPVREIEEWNPFTLTFSTVSNLVNGRSNFEAVIATQLVVGPGQGTSGPLSNAEIVNPFSTSIDVVGTNAARAGATLTVLPSPGWVVVSGGRDGSGVRSDLELINMVAVPPTLLNDRPALQVPRADARSVEVPNTGALIVGGVSANGLATDECEVFAVDPGADLFGFTGTLGRTTRTVDERSSMARTRHTVTLLNTGVALIVGGVDQRGVVIGGAELFRR